MNGGLTPDQEIERLKFRKFVSADIEPYAENFDRDEKIPPELIQLLARERLLGAALPESWGARSLDWITYGILHEEIGRACSSIRSLLTVHDMVAHAILRWGTSEQRERWLPALIRGEVIAGFALSEPNVGSDARNVETTATPDSDQYVLNGTKKWITGGQIAGVFLVLAQCEGKPTALLCERERRGLTITPISSSLGMKASMLAELTFADYCIPKTNRLSNEGLGFSHVAANCLNLGRYSVAWGCVGIGQACLDACLDYSHKREQFGRRLNEHQLVQRMISDIVTELKAARLLCIEAGALMSSGHPDVLVETMIAKYFASGMATRAASAAVQIHGANGCDSKYSVGRFFRDAKIMEIIEGTNELQQQLIAQHAHRS
jgi:alkylation response protein AidB-like acyl-CoA dehydrogenase